MGAIAGCLDEFEMAAIVVFDEFKGNRKLGRFALKSLLRDKII